MAVAKKQRVAGRAGNCVTWPGWFNLIESSGFAFGGA